MILIYYKDSKAINMADKPTRFRRKVQRLGMINWVENEEEVFGDTCKQSEYFEAIGIDVEQLNRMKEGSIERIIHPLEKAEIGSDLKKATLLFSIKEAFYKAQFPLYSTPLNFKDVAFEYDFLAQKAQLIWLAEKSPIPKKDYSDWVITYQIIETTCFALCSKYNKIGKSN